MTSPVTCLQGQKQEQLQHASTEILNYATARKTHHLKEKTYCVIILRLQPTRQINPKVSEFFSSHGDQCHLFCEERWRSGKERLLKVQVYSSAP